MTQLSVRNLTSGYKRSDIIHNMTFEAQPGELIALIGPNGSGKSTLMKTLIGQLPCKSGEIWVGKTPLEFFDIKERARELSYLPQSRVAMPEMSVMEILELGRAPFRGRLGHISSTGRDVINRIIKICALEAFTDRKFGELSGGEQARALLGRMLVVDAPVILADEPIAALDPFYQLATLEILKKEARRGKVVIVALHDLTLAAKFADQIIVMNEGKLVSKGASAQFLSSNVIEQVFKVRWDDLVNQ